ncbi:MAG: insulinase family protein [Clostridiales bacterium]|nr:insulinase family protein [Clostridiales bacterium]
MLNITTKRNDFLREEYYTFTHKSGLPVYVFPKKLSTSYALFATRYGSIDSRFKLAGDADFTTVPDGIAHYLEHKLFENPNGEDTFSRYAKYGANANAYTSNNKTAYLFSCTSNFKESLEILLDFVTTPYFTPETVEKEQGIIAQEIRMYDDHPFYKLYQMLLEGLYEKHNVRINVAGTVESISHITSDILYECYRVFYNLSNMVLIVCGDVSVDDVNEVCDKVLKEQTPVEIIRDYPEERAEVYKVKSECNMEVAKPMFGIGIKDVAIPEDGYERMKKYAAGEILNDVLFGKSGEFYNRLYEEGLLSSQFACGYELNKSFAFNSLLGESKSPDEVFERFKACVENAKANGLSREDFERSKRALYAAMVKCFDSTDDIANYFLNYVIDDGDLLDYVDILAGVTFEDVTKLLNEAYKPEYYSIAVVNPITHETQEGV